MDHFAPAGQKTKKKSAVTRAFECGWNVLDNELVEVATTEKP